MNAATIQAVGKEDLDLLDRLARLLEEQIHLLRHSDITGRQTETLAGQTEALAEEIAQKHLLAMAQFADRREHIKRMYDNLNLAVIARKAETQEQLVKIRKGKKMIDLYRDIF